MTTATTAVAPAKAKLAPKVTAKIVELHFRQDHTVGDPNKKLIRPSAGDFKDAASVFTKPEWNGSKSDPASYTKDTVVVVDLVVELTISPPGKTVNLQAIKGASSEECLNFEKTLSQSVGAGRTIIYWVGAFFQGAAKKLPNSVQKIQGDIAWTLTVDGKDLSIGTTGRHTLYVTLDTPIGKMSKPTGKSIEQTGADQDVTEERLNYSVTAASGENTEKGCCKGIYNRFKTLGLVYSLGNRYPDTAGGITFHHYLWKEANDSMLGECHMLAASFILASRILGVKGSLEIGYIFPWGRREGSDPYKQRTNPVHGKYNVADIRSHVIKRSWRSDIDHGGERMCFTDGNGGNNNFEGVACLDNKTLYAIGEDIIDSEATANANADKWYEGANFDLFFTGGPAGRCDNPYPDGVTKMRFKWKD